MQTRVIDDRDLQLHYFHRLQTVDISALLLPSAPRYMLCSPQFASSLLGFQLHVLLHDLFAIKDHFASYDLYSLK